MEKLLTASSDQLMIDGYLYVSRSKNLEEYFNKNYNKTIIRNADTWVIHSIGGKEFKDRDDFLRYTMELPKVEEKQKREKQLRLTENDLIQFYGLGFMFMETSPDQVSRYYSSKKKKEVYLDNLTKILYVDGSCVWPFKNIEELLNYCGEEQKPHEEKDKGCSVSFKLKDKESDPNATTFTLCDVDFEFKFKKRQEPEKEDFRPCPNIQEALNDVMKDSKFNTERTGLQNARELKKKLEDEIIEKLNTFESETGCRINEVRFLKQNTIIGNDDSYKNLINIIAVV